MTTARDFPAELGGNKIDPQLYRRLNQLFEMVYRLQESVSQAPAVAQKAVTQQLQSIGLLGPLGQSLIGLSSSPDPQLQNLPTNNGTVTSINANGVNNVAVTGGPITSSGSLTITFSLTPAFTTVNVGAGGYLVSGTKVVGAQGAAVADATGVGDVVAQLNAWLARARAHGLIS
jgi:hypothetical protein